MHQDYRSHGQMGFAQPHRRAIRFVEMDGHQHPVDDAVERIENPFPANRAERNGRYPGQKDEKSNDAAPAKSVFQSYRQNRRTNDDHDLRKDRKDEGILQCNFETWTLNHAAKVRQPDKMNRVAADPDIAECIDKRQYEW